MAWKKNIIDRSDSEVLNITSSTNGKIKVNGVDLVVYDESGIRSTIETRLNEESNLILTSVTGGGLLVASDTEFNGTANTTKIYTQDHNGFSIVNDGQAGVDPALTFTINGLTYTVKAGESYFGAFKVFRQVTIVTTVPYRAHPLSYLNMSV